MTERLEGRQSGGGKSKQGRVADFEVREEQVGGERSHVDPTSCATERSKRISPRGIRKAGECITNLGKEKGGEGEMEVRFRSGKQRVVAGSALSASAPPAGLSSSRIPQPLIDFYKSCIWIDRAELVFVMEHLSDSAAALRGEKNSLDGGAADRCKRQVPTPERLVF